MLAPDPLSGIGDHEEGGLSQRGIDYTVFHCKVDSSGSAVARMSSIGSPGMATMSELHSPAVIVSLSSGEGPERRLHVPFWAASR